jgi:hypothetical protein
MKKITVLLFIAATIFSCGWQKKIQENLTAYTATDKERDSLLVKSFSAVDLIVKKNKTGKSYYCEISVIKTLEEKTGISSTGDGSIVGKKFTRQDWLKWHEWFKLNFRNDE